MNVNLFCVENNIVSLYRREIHFGLFQVLLDDINAENITKMKLAYVRRFKYFCLMTPKQRRFGIIVKGCQRIENRQLGIGRLKVCNRIKKRRKEYVRLNYYEK